MNFFSFITIYIILIMVLISCSDSLDETTNPENERPVCNIISPSDGSNINFGDSIVFSVNAYDNDGSVDHVRFYINGSPVDTVDTEPYNITFYSRYYQLGELELRVNVRDNEGKENVDQINVFLTSEYFVNVLSPNGGEYMPKGESRYIKWQSDLNEYVRIELYKNNNFLYEIIDSTQNDGEYSWAIPVDLESLEEYKIKISGTERTDIYDLSDNHFTLTYAPTFDYILLLEPNGSEVLKKDSEYLIKWNSNFSDDVAIDLYKGGSFFNNIAYHIENTGLFSWAISDTLETGNNYKLKIKRSADPDFEFDYSDDFFIID